MRGALLALVLATGCRQAVELLPARDLGSSNDGGGGGSITVPTAGGDSCAAALAATLHRFALCACSATSLTRNLATTVFDSTGAATDRTGAAIGIDGDFGDDKAVTLEGALYASGTLQLGDGLQTQETLRANGGLTTQGTTNVNGDAFLGGNVSGPVVIGGTLHVPDAATVAGTVQAGAVVRQPVTVGDPCDCATASGVGVAAAVQAAATANDNAAISLGTGALTANASLPAGRFYVASLATPSDQTVTLAVHGRAALYVAGDVTLKGALDVALDSGAELDLIIGGTLTTQSNKSFGALAAPARFRIWTATASVALGGRPVLGAVISAPAAAVSADNGLEVYGSLLVRSFATDNDATFRYDQAILSSGGACGGASVPPVR